MDKIVKIGLLVLGAVAAILWTQLPSRDVPVGEAVESGAVHWMFMVMYVLLGVAVLISLVFAVKNLFENPKTLMKTIFVVVGFLVVVGLAYVISDGGDGTVEEMASRGVATTESTVKKIGAGLNVFFILVIIAVLTMLWGAVKNMTNK